MPLGLCLLPFLFPLHHLQDQLLLQPNQQTLLPVLPRQDLHQHGNPLLRGLRSGLLYLRQRPGLSLLQRWRFQSPGQSHEEVHSPSWLLLESDCSQWYLSFRVHTMQIFNFLHRMCQWPLPGLEWALLQHLPQQVLHQLPTRDMRAMSSRLPLLQLQQGLPLLQL